MSNVEARLDALVQQMGVTIVESGKLGSFLNACFHEPTRTIIVRTGLDPATRVCAIAHELGHAHYGHDCSSPRAECEADEWAAEKLLTLDNVKSVARECEGSLTAISATLGVTPQLLSQWMHMYQSGRFLRHPHCTIR